MFNFLLLLSYLLTVTTASVSPECSCGYRDPNTQEVFTEALIVYFNETTTLDPEIFTLQNYAHKKQQGWNSIYKVGAQPNNTNITTYNAYNRTQQDLQLWLQPSDKLHLVKGAELITKRQDIQYGSFQASMKGATQWTGGTALSFILKYNASESLQVDWMNMKEPDLARVSNLINGEWPSDDTVTTYAYLIDHNITQPWNNFSTIQIDWNKTNVNFFIEGTSTRSVATKDQAIPLAGQALHLQTWSTGDKTYMQGPPSGNATTSHIRWIRNFFNSTAMTTEQHAAWDQRCSGDIAPICSTANISLRDVSPYSEESTKTWAPPVLDNNIRATAGVVAGACSTFGILALINVFFRRTPWHKLRPKSKGSRESTDSLTAYFARSMPWSKHRGNKSSDSDSQSESSTHVIRSGGSWNASSSGVNTGVNTPLPAYGARTPPSGSQTPAPAYETPRSQSAQAGLYRSASLASLRSAGHAPRPAVDERVPQLPALHRVDNEKDPAPLHRISEVPRQAQINEFDDIAQEKSARTSEYEHHTTISEKGKEALVHVKEAVKVNITPHTTVPEPSKPTVPSTAANATSGKPAPTKRIDYLAGLVAVACMGVTLHHFIQTFWPWVSNGYGPGAHYPVPEKWIKFFVGDYILTQLWIGPFFLTATRFLTTNYLKNGNLEDIAKKEIRRAPRLFGPILITSALEYFFLEMGLTAALQYLPSVSWSTWPYVVPQPNFGVYLNNLVELAYAMPNVIPEVVQHYCIGVLWTVPVQLQFTYVVLAGAVLIRDIKNPYKRFGFYALMIATGWYAKSWAACHWAGLVLSDLEATYKWRAYLKARPVQLYAVMTFAFICAAGSPLAAVFSSDWSFNTAENSIHPDLTTGRPIREIDPLYPNYNEPDLVTLTFSIGLQILVELSTSVQWFLSTKLVLLMHPHIMTIYLTHGFVMWTWGAFIAVQLNQWSVPYWANLLVTLVTTYGFIFGLASVLTPLIDFPTQALMRNIDRWMKDEPRKKRQSTAPFTKAIVIDRHKVESEKKDA
ncbi:Glycosyl hydrolases family 16 [Acrodontium crateriforme]|uniref:Glycosyl hydrolases family 16 n=1 Tax=Acrodontium crateriforme TaxID=150365 RepID=A0AAQ3M8V4_9PEZI|nr:Glycosyl hydrolases family 16 [Acrodontium crateriforme]